MRGIENLWLAATQVKCIWPELNGLTTTVFELKNGITSLFLTSCATCCPFCRGRGKM